MTTNQVGAQPSGDGRLAFLDGVRGIAALWVLIHHTVKQVETGSHRSLSGGLSWISVLFHSGYQSVEMFIVLSGFCLMLPVVRNPQSRISGGLLQYAIRRCRRILPAYYAALLFTLLLALAVPGLQHKSGLEWDAALPIFAIGPVVSHLFLVHDLLPYYFSSIDPPMWSVAIEWHIYFLFPALVAGYRKWGIHCALGIAVVVGYLIHWWHEGIMDFAQPHFAGLFALGMTACWIARGEYRNSDTLRRAPWGHFSALVFCFWFTIEYRYLVLPVISSHSFIKDYIFGVASSCLLVALAMPQVTSKPVSMLKRLVEIRAPVTVGVCSYSLYLFHYPLLAAAYLVIRQVTPSMLGQLLIFWLLICPAVIALSWVSYQFIEQPWMRRR